jgi:C4-dicarboxylate-specific signal transduction histidine kinase
MATMRDEVQVDSLQCGCGGAGLLDAVRALSAQSGRDAVLRTLAQSVLELAGARRAVLIGIDDRGPVVEAIARIREGRPQIRLLRAAPAAHGVAPDLLARAIASGQPAGIGSAALCLPMPGQTALAGLLYVESAAAKFSDARLEALSVLAAQAAVALDTARRMAALAEENAARRRIEQALRESQAMLVLGEQISQSGSWSWRPGQAVLDCTAQFCRMFGLGECKVAVPFEAFLARVHGDDRERVRQHSSDAVAQGLPFLIEYRAFDGAGSLRFISAAGRPLTPPRGEYGVSLASAAYVGTAVDVTERRAFEDNLRQAQAELARVARLTTVGQLTASIAHEVNQPLMSIASDAGAALRWLDRAPADLQQARASLRDIAAQSERAGAIIAGLQALTRKAPAQLGPVDLHDTVRDILAISRVELERHHVALELALLASPSVVTGDAVQLQQLLLNLVINAVEAMATVVGRARLLAICSWSAGDGRIAVRIDDAGVGLAPGARGEALFEPFYTTKEHGMGMGLAICRSIVQAHHGAITATARQPHGCSVEFYLPALGERP